MDSQDKYSFQAKVRELGGKEVIPLRKSYNFGNLDPRKLNP